MIAGAYPEFSEDTEEFTDSHRWMWLPVDMSDPVEARYCVGQTLKQFGHADAFFYYPDAEKEGVISSDQSAEHPTITYVKKLWSGLAATLPLLRAGGGGNVIAVADISSDAEWLSIGDIQTKNYRIRVDLINTIQTYQLKRQPNRTNYKQITPERIARLALSMLAQEKQDEVEWNEVLSWTSEYLDSAF